jgi:hypothetical protein
MPAVIRDNLLAVLLSIFFTTVSSSFYLALTNTALETREWMRDYLAKQDSSPELYKKLAHCEKVNERQDLILGDINRHLVEIKETLDAL